MAFSITLNGARGETRAAMETALEKQDLSPAEINDAYRGLIDLLEGLDPNVDVALANSIWYREGLPVTQAFSDTNRTHFDAEVAALDFAAPSAADQINGWVNDETRGNIPKIVLARILQSTVMYLINATYFKGPWRNQFDSSNTEQGTFHQTDGSTVTVPMMEKTEAVVHPTHVHGRSVSGRRRRMRRQPLQHDDPAPPRRRLERGSSTASMPRRGPG